MVVAMAADIIEAVTVLVIMQRLPVITVAVTEVATADTMVDTEVDTGAVIAGNPPGRKRSYTINNKCLARGICYL
jgi:hypothetical protein